GRLIGSGEAPATMQVLHARVCDKRPMPDEINRDARKRADEHAEARDEAEVEEALKEESDSGFSLSDEERRDVEERSAPRAALLHEIVRRAGQEELKRNIATLAWSAFAAGLTMGFSFLARGVLHRHMEGLPGAFLVDSLGYTFGFLAVIVARQQLFTENVLTAVLPDRKSTRLNSSHVKISYAVFCLKKK